MGPSPSPVKLWFRPVLDRHFKNPPALRQPKGLTGISSMTLIVVVIDSEQRDRLRRRGRVQPPESLPYATLFMPSGTKVIAVEPALVFPSQVFQLLPWTFHLEFQHNNAQQPT